FTGGLELKSILPLSSAEKDSQPSTDSLLIKVPADLISKVEQKVRQFELQDTMPFVKVKKDTAKSYDLKQVIISISLQEDALHIVKLLQSPNVYDLLSALFEVGKDDLYEWQISRMRFSF
ncbi:MAG: hypothetical protein R6V77_02130, partial [Candidatus Cloacimonadaceae bacterium]